MMTVLKGETIDTMERFFRENGSKNPCFRSNPAAISDWLTRLSKNRCSEGGDFEFDNIPLKWIEDMLNEVEQRPSSRQLMESILASPTNPDQGITLFGICCERGELESGEVDPTSDTLSFDVCASY
jgi:hypothetical protein